MRSVQARLVHTSYMTTSKQVSKSDVFHGLEHIYNVIYLYYIDIYIYAYIYTNQDVKIECPWRLYALSLDDRWIVRGSMDYPRLIRG